MEEIWTQIESWMGANVPKGLEILQSGASDAEISELEDFLSIQFPDDIKSSYRLHNGQSISDFGLVDGREFLSLERVKEEWQVWKGLLESGTFQTEDGRDQGCQPALGICNVWWSPKWIPLTYDGSGNHDCLDLNPTSEGTVGQIIAMWRDDPERKIVAPSFRAWLKGYAEALESGHFIFSEDYNGIVNVDNL
jgi:cell wall assembly regulator SMI1